jgi:two-component system OmpR family sensor kinase
VIPASRRWTLRRRLAVWHAAAIVLILAATAAVADVLLARALEQQLDASLVALAETEAASALDDPSGAIHLHVMGGGGRPAPLRALDKLAQIVDADGRVLERNALLGERALPAGPALLARLRRGEVVLETVETRPGDLVRLASLPIEVNGAFRYAVQVGASLAPQRAFLRTVRLLIGAAGSAIVAAVVLLGAELTRRALRPVDALIRAARRIGGGPLTERLPEPGTDDEIGRLAATLNEMLARLVRAVEAERRFTADAAHELRSPLSRLRAGLEIALRRSRAPAEYEEVLREALEEAVGLSTLADDLLTLARLDAAGRPPAVPIALDEAVAGLVEPRRAEAEQRGLTLHLDLRSAADVRVSAHDLGHLLRNLLDNALKFSRPGGRIRIRTAAADGSASLAVSDTGAGMAAKDLPHVFERFYRGAGPGPEAPGVGLGLAICRAVAEAHGGRIQAESSPGVGTTITVTLPTVPRS